MHELFTCRRLVNDGLYRMQQICPTWNVGLNAEPADDHYTSYPAFLINH
jgi:hypothetical protein